jgi:hypothetical protein
VKTAVAVFDNAPMPTKDTGEEELSRLKQGHVYQVIQALK